MMENTKKPAIRFKGYTEAWEQRKLSELATMHARIGWQNLRTSEFLDSGDYMLITGTDFEDGAINYSTCHYVEKMRYDQDTHIQIDNGSILSLPVNLFDFICTGCQVMLNILAPKA